MARRPNHITQADGRVITVLNPRAYFTHLQIRLGRSLTAAERREAKRLRAAGVKWTDAALLFPANTPAEGGR